MRIRSAELSPLFVGRGDVTHWQRNLIHWRLQAQQKPPQINQLSQTVAISKQHSDPNTFRQLHRNTARQDCCAENIDISGSSGPIQDFGDILETHIGAIFFIYHVKVHKYHQANVVTISKVLIGQYFSNYCFIDRSADFNTWFCWIVEVQSTNNKPTVNITHAVMSVHIGQRTLTDVKGTMSAEWYVSQDLK